MKLNILIKKYKLYANLNCEFSLIKPKCVYNMFVLTNYTKL